MTDDISKKITIEVEAKTEDFAQNITNLGKTIDGLLAKQGELTASGQKNSEAFKDISSKLEELQKKLQDANTQVNANATALNTLNTAAKTATGSLASLSTQQQTTAKAVGDSSAKVKELSSQMGSLAKATKQQAADTAQGKNSIEGYAGSITASAAGVQQLKGNISSINSELTAQASVVTENKTAFDAHKATMDHLKKSFDEIKGVSGLFGPSLKEAAEGFDVMKSGLKLVQDGFTGVGAAIKADGFDFLLKILQMLFDHFVKSSEGSKVLKGAISAVGVVIKEVKEFVSAFMTAMLNAFSHPVETLKSLGKMIEENLINRFKAVGVILDGIIHLDFKKVANGAIEAFTGVADATDKISTGFTAIKNGVEETAGKMVTAYKDGYDKAGKHVDDHEAKVKESLERQIAYYKDLSEKVNETYAEQNRQGSENTGQRGPQLSAGKQADVTISNAPTGDQSAAVTNFTINQNVNNDNKIKENALQKFEEYAKQSDQKIASAAFSILSNSIKQQSDAKIAALEKDKAAELSNRSLTSAQKLAIEQKYKKQEGQVKAKAFKEEQEASIAQAVINGALAITKGTAQTGILAELYIPTIIAETAVEVAKIAAQKPPAYARGGLHYTSDGRGGVLPGYSRTDNTNAYLRSGEGVVVSEAMQVPWARNLVSAINVGFGGRDFAITNPGRGYAVGGIFTDGGDANRYYNQPVNDQKNLANTIAYQMINNFPPVYVDVKDVNNQQNILAQTINRVNL